MDFGQQTLAAHSADPHRLICHCLNVTEHEIRAAIDEHDPQSIRAVSQVCGAGGGCMSCHRHIRRMMNERVLYRRAQLVGDGNVEPTCSEQVPCSH